MEIRTKQGYVKANNCPHCGETLGAFTGMTNDKDVLILPCEGDLTVCLYCKTVLKFQDFNYVFGTKEEWSDVEPCLRELTEKHIGEVRFSTGDN
jgi:hypothetical protein